MQAQRAKVRWCMSRNYARGEAVVALMVHSRRTLLAAKRGEGREGRSSSSEGEVKG